MTDQRVMRVNYYERQFLRAQDFSDEQAYHIGMRRRHNLAHHIWGIVRGLELEYSETDRTFTVKPGIAVDGYGRELIVTEPRSYEIGIFQNFDGDRIDLWLEYRLKAAAQSSVGRICAADEEAANNVDRWEEVPEIVLRADTVNDTDRRSPRSVPASENFSASQTPPDSPERYFPVYLGQMCRTTIGRQTTYTAELLGRPYAGVVGSEILHPTGKVRVELCKDNRPHFAVYIAKQDTKQAVRTSKLQPQRQFNPQSAADGDALVQPALKIHRNLFSQNYEIELNGNMQVVGDVNITGALEFTLPATPATTSSLVPNPGAIYLSKPDNELVNSNVRELRVELGKELSDPTRFTVGVWSEEKKFKPILQIENGKVTVTGTLIAQRIALLDVVPRQTEEAMRLLAERRLSSRTVDAGLGTLLDKLLRTITGKSGDKPDDILS